MSIADLITTLPSLPAEWDHTTLTFLREDDEQRIAERVSGRLNAALGLGSRSLLRHISEATCGRGDVYVIHSSDEVLNFLMEGILEDRLTNVELRRAPLDSIPAADRTFDTVFVLFQLHHESDPVLALREVRRVLAPQGRAVILESFSRRAPPQHSVPPDDCWPSGTMIEMWALSAGLTPVAAERVNHGLLIRNGTRDFSLDTVLVEAAPDDEITSLQGGIPPDARRAP